MSSFFMSSFFLFSNNFLRASWISDKEGTLKSFFSIISFGNCDFELVIVFLSCKLLKSSLLIILLNNPPLV